MSQTNVEPVEYHATVSDLPPPPPLPTGPPPIPRAGSVEPPPLPLSVLSRQSSSHSTLNSSPPLAHHLPHTSQTLPADLRVPPPVRRNTTHIHNTIDLSRIGKPELMPMSREEISDGTQQTQSSPSAFFTPMSTPSNTTSLLTNPSSSRDTTSLTPPPPPVPTTQPTSSFTAPIAPRQSIARPYHTLPSTRTVEKPVPAMSVERYFNEMQTVKHYLSIGIQQRKLEALKLALDKSDSMMQAHSNAHAELLNRPEYREEAAKLVTLVGEGKELREKLVRENIQSMEYYLKQGVMGKNREILREIILKSCLYDRSQFNKELLTSAEAMLRLLDDHHMARVTLQDAMNTKNMDVLNVALAHSTMFLTRKDTDVEGIVTAEDRKMVEDANKLYAQLLRRRQASEQAALAASGKNKGKNAAPAVLDKVVGGDVERITNSFHTIASMSTAIVKSKQIDASAGPELSLRVDDDDEHLDQLGDFYVKVPLLVYDCIQYLRRNDAIEEVGIFRQAGSRDAMEEILAKYEDLYARAKRRGGIIQEDLSKTFIPPQSPVSQATTDTSTSTSVVGPTSLSSTAAASTSVDGVALPSVIYDSFQSVHDAANILKRFFRELADPLIPYSDYEKWLAVAGKCRSDPLVSSGSTINANGGSVLNMTSRALINSVPIQPINGGHSAGGGGGVAGVTSGLAAFSLTSPTPSPPPVFSPNPVPGSTAAPSISSIQTVSCSLKETLAKSPALQELRNLLQKLSTRRYSLLHYLCIFLHCITKHSKVNKMTSDNIAIVFAPNIIKPQVETQTSMVSDGPLIIFVVHCLVKYATVLFDVLQD